jgi:hypothetical protein
VKRYAEVRIAGRSERQIETEALDVQQHGDAADQSVVASRADRGHGVADVRDRGEAAVHRGREAPQDD